MNRKSMGSSLMLLLTAFIWGVAFVAQSVGMEYVRPFTFNAARFILGGLVLIPVIVFMRREKTDRFRESSETWEGIKGGILCGIALFVAASFQQFGVSMTTVGKAGFITALYIVIVPILGVFMRKKVPAFVWVSVALATVGMYLLCITEGFRIGTGDLCVFICAVCFSFHILIIDCVSPKADGVLISCIQFFTAGVLALIPAAFLEKPSGGVFGKTFRRDCTGGVAAHCLCRNHVQRRRLYPSGGSPEEHGSDSGFSSYEPGIRVFPAGRLGDPGAEAVAQGTAGLRPGICGGDFGPAAGQGGRMKLQGRSFRILT